MSLIKGAFFGEKNFDVIKMHGTTINIKNFLSFHFPTLSVGHVQLPFVFCRKTLFLCRLCYSFICDIMVTFVSKLHCKVNVYTHRCWPVTSLKTFPILRGFYAFLQLL
jgi:hypothetical protein